MRHGRAKASRRTLQFYRLNAPHLKSPYKILLDGTFLVAATRNKVPLVERFSKILQHEQFTCYVTRSTLNELELLSQQRAKGKQSGDSDESNSVFFDQARQYGLDECEIIENCNTVANTNEKVVNKRAFRDFSEASRDIYCLATDGGNNGLAYFVATQDDVLSDALRGMPYVPLFRLGRAVLLLESPSSASRQFTGNLEQNKLKSAGGLMTSEERKIVDKVKKNDKRKRRELLKEEQQKLEKRSREEIGGCFNERKKKRAKGPNPLSCKSKKSNS
jgi:U3 small nucleolar RNA-associated protein 23